MCEDRKPKNNLILFLSTYKFVTKEWPYYGTKYEIGGMYEKEKENIQVGAFVKIHGKKDRSDSMIANALTWIKEK